MAKLAFRVLRGPWTAAGEGTFVDEVSVDDPSSELVRYAAHAHDAGLIEVTEGLAEKHVESQEQSEKNLAKAQGSWVERTWDDEGRAVPGYWDGPWGVGHATQYDLEVAQAALAEAHASGDAAAVKAAEKNLRKVDADIQGRLS